MPINYAKPEPLTLKLHPELDEKWVQKLIEDDPSALGLGELQFRGRERIQAGGGRLDLLLQDPETNRRYEVEIQLGATDPSHIIRTIEYWDIERKRYPQYDHCAVLVAEDITSRFLNVISLFNGSVPLIAIQMQALKVGDHTTLVFTTVLGERRLGLEDEDEGRAPRTSRADWESRAKATVAIADQLLEIIHQVDPSITLNYTQFGGASSAARIASTPSGGRAGSIGGREHRNRDGRGARSRQWHGRRGGPARGSEPFRAGAMILDLPVRPGLRILVASRPVDFRRGMDSLSTLVKELLAIDPFAGDVFVFRAKRAQCVS